VKVSIPEGLQCSADLPAVISGAAMKKTEKTPYAIFATQILSEHPVLGAASFITLKTWLLLRKISGRNPLMQNRSSFAPAVSLYFKWMTR
jgi:hypothetical protein